MLISEGRCVVLGNFFDQLLGFFELFVMLIVNLFKSLGQAIVVLSSGAAFVGDMVKYLPSVLGSGVLVFFAVAIVKFLLGR